MILIRKEIKMCYDCMEVHEVKVVKIKEWEIFNNKKVFFDAEYDYCENTDGLLENEDQIRKNYLAMENAYRMIKEVF